MKHWGTCLTPSCLVSYARALFLILAILGLLGCVATTEPSSKAQPPRASGSNPSTVAGGNFFSGEQYGNLNLYNPQSSATLEAVLGANPNFEALDTYPARDRLRQLARPVGRLDIKLSNGQMDYCTAFLVATDLAITNHHCMPRRDGLRALEATLWMGYYSQVDQEDARRFAVSGIQVSDPGLDYSLIQVQGNPGSTYGTVKLGDRDPDPGESLLVIHHPGGKPKHITRGNCRAAHPRALNGQVLFHSCDTLGGSSGAPILNASDGTVVALHYGGAQVGLGYNEAKRMVEIVRQDQRLAALGGGAVASSVPAVPTVPTVAPAAPVISAARAAVGEVFRDTLRSGGEGPEMVVIPGGEFWMGSPESESGRRSDERRRRVRVASIAIGRYEVTFDEYDRFAETTGRDKPNDEGSERGNRPVINVSWHDAMAYAEWLSSQTGESYRLPTEAEWEYAARAGNETVYWWYKSGADGENNFGLHDTVENDVSEWTCSVYDGNYSGSEQHCSANFRAMNPRTVRGAIIYYNYVSGATSTLRTGYAPSDRSNGAGFRLARSL